MTNYESSEYVKLWYWIMENYPDIFDKFEKEIYREAFEWLIHASVGVLSGRKHTWLTFLPIGANIAGEWFNEW